MKNLFVKKGDTVLVIAGKDKNKQAKVLEAFPQENKVIVEGVNVVVKHQKPRSAQDKGGKIEKEAKIDASNVQVICPECKKATRVAETIVDGKKHRTCKKCGASLDKAFVAKKSTAKKAEAKKEVAAKKATTTKKATASKKTETVKAAPKKAAASTTKKVAQRKNRGDK